MKRPAGIVVLVILGFMAVPFLAIGGIVDLAVATRPDANSGGAGLIANLGPAPGVVMLVLAACFITLCSGLWRLKQWARLFTICFVCLTIFFFLVGTVGWLRFGFLPITPLVVNGLIVWYLLKSDVKDKFS